ncbi:hypothetical protein [Lactococcus lactis]|uniref:hypothetical protein n=1 Tax=Lactococcus lactis TaxID=1358 RepID=UPI0035CC178D
MFEGNERFSKYYNYSLKILLEAVNKKIETKKIDFQFKKNNGEKRRIVTTNNLTLFIKFYDMKLDDKFSYPPIL